MATATPVRILCLDGGGIRGISSLYLLKELMAQVNRQRPKTNPPQPPLRPCNAFDLICGTSTGGLIALMLGRLEMDVPQAITCYKELSQAIFTSSSKRKGEKFDHRVLEEKIKLAISSSPLGLHYDALAANPSSTSCKTFTVAIRTRGGANTAAIMRTYDSTAFDAFTGRIWEAARATSAAPTFFLPITIDDIVYGDGGAGGYNNPAELAVQEVDYIWGEKQKIACLISLGTGQEPAIQLQNPEAMRSNSWLESTLKTLAPNKAFDIEVARYLINCLTNCEIVHGKIESQRARYGVQNGYFRLNVPLPKIGLEEWERISDIVNLTDGHTQSPSFVDLKKKIATILLDPRSAVPTQARDRNGRTALHRAAMRGDEQEISIILEQDLDCINELEERAYGGTALHIAIRNHHGRTLKLLMDYGADVNCSARDNFWTPVQTALSEGFTEGMITLLDHGANPNQGDATQKTAMHHAALTGSGGMIQYLIVRGAAADVPDDMGRTPFHFAGMASAIEAMGVLLDNGANIDAQDVGGNTMLHVAAANAMHDIVRFLLGRDADRNVRDRNGVTPLDLARAQGDQTAVQLLAPAQAPVVPPPSQIAGAPAPSQATDVPAPAETAEVPQGA